jgi:hypothetical protein
LFLSFALKNVTLSGVGVVAGAFRIKWVYEFGVGCITDEGVCIAEVGVRMCEVVGDWSTS